MEGRAWPGGAGEEELSLRNQLQGEPIHWGREESPRDRAVLGGAGLSSTRGVPGSPGVLRTDPSGHAWWDCSFLRCDSGTGLGCLQQDGAPGTVASSFASPQHLGISENQTSVSPGSPLSPCHPQGRLRPVLLERWGHRRPPPILEGSPLGSGGQRCWEQAHYSCRVSPEFLPAVCAQGQRSEPGALVPSSPPMCLSAPNAPQTGCLRFLRYFLVDSQR